eukprot:CAMPEP_0170575072 /NCGR_PEP_ID=MMETSP0224-20130122/3656_1 /TAXON_ID=285029 /ORGANISM="Togula jolla, Strain CCCM 725" /LENGTH=310 /DNA_ID=CAMNT_0010897807 /DNA_START=12 /DNA_END=940 /DNA_ORIENTATION=-
MAKRPTSRPTSRGRAASGDSRTSIPELVGGAAAKAAPASFQSPAAPLPPLASAVRLRDLLSDGSDGGESPLAGQSNELRRRLISPLQVHFSQSHIRPEFQDGQTVEESLSQIGAEFLSPVVADEVCGAPMSGDGWWLLRPPFPEIEVIQWRCKLRDEDGALKLDDQGMELYGAREWYTLDNRRLYCLQRAACRYWPAEVRCIVTIIRQEEGSSREFRKFRTPDLGRSVRIGHRDSTELPRWSWRREVGAPEEPPPTGSALPRPPKRRNSERRVGPNSGANGRGPGRHGNQSEQVERGPWDVVMNIALFLL